MPFDFDLLPSSLRPWIEDIAERVQCPPDFPAIAAMIAIAAVVGRQVGIRPKRKDDWLVVPNLWGAAIGPPSVMKTPAIQEPLKPLKRLEIDAALNSFVASSNSRSQLVAEQRKQMAKSEIRQALNEPGGDALEVARDAIAQEVLQPTRRRFPHRLCSCSTAVRKKTRRGRFFSCVIAAAGVDCSCFLGTLVSSGVASS